MKPTRFEVVKVTVTTTGNDGSATGSGTTDHPINGRLHAVYLDFASGAHANTDTTIALSEAPSATLLTVTDSKTDAWYFPRQQVHSTAGAGLTYDGTRTVCEPFAVAGNLTVSVAQSNDDAACVTAYLYIEQ